MDEREAFVAREMARSDLYFFARYAMRETRGQIFQRAPHHKVICDALMRVYRGEFRRLIINIPPRYSKTQLAVIDFIAWSLGRAPDSEFIHTSYSGRLAASNSWQARELVSSPWYQGIFQDACLLGDSAAKDEWRTTATGCVYAVGAGGSITGYGAGKVRHGFGGAVIIDDPHKADEARSEIQRNNVIEWFRNTLESRVNSRETPIILIMQRLHEEDLAGWLLAGGNGEKWEHVCLPALRPDGTALWPEKHTVKELRRMEDAAPYTFSGQYQQRPTPPEGGVFKPDRMMPNEDASQATSWVRAWDLAATSDDGDWTAGVLMGRSPSGHYFVRDVARLRGGPDEVERRIVATALLDGKSTRVSLPQDPGQAGKSQILYLTRALAGFRVVSSPETGDKETRAEPFAAQVNVGNVSYVPGDWNRSFVEELRNFPFGRYDDQVDASSRAFNTLMEVNRPLKISSALIERSRSLGRKNWG